MNIIRSSKIKIAHQLNPKLKLEALKVSTKILIPFDQKPLSPQFSANFKKASQDIQAKEPKNMTPYDLNILQNSEEKNTWDCIKDLSVLWPEKLVEFEANIIQLLESGYREEILDFIKQNPNNLKFMSKVLSYIIDDNEDKNLDKELFELIKAEEDLYLLQNPLSVLVYKGFAKEIFELIKNRKDLNLLSPLLINLVYLGFEKSVFDLIKARKDLNQFSQVLSVVATNENFAQKVLELLKQQEKINMFRLFVDAYYLNPVAKEIQNLIEKYPHETKDAIEICNDYLVTTKDFSKEDFTKYVNLSFCNIFKTKILELLKQNPKNLHLFPSFLRYSCTNGKSNEVWKLLTVANSIQIKSLQEVLNIFIDKGDENTRQAVWKFIVENLDKLESFPPITLQCFISNGYRKQIFELLKENPNYIKHFQHILSKQKKENPQSFLKLVKQNYKKCNEDGLDALISIIFNISSLNFQTFSSKKELILAFIKHISGFSDEQKKMFFNCTNPLSMFLEAPCRLEFEKNGSELNLTYFPQWGTIITNIIPANSFRVWKSIHDKWNIPVAPILSTEQSTRRNKIAVHSRYCGINLSDLNKRYSKSLPELVQLADAKVEKIKEALSSIQIEHGHPHNENFTIEFICKEYYKERLGLGESVNTIEYDPAKFSFNSEEYAKNSDKWLPIIRLIDWDEARLIS